MKPASFDYLRPGSLDEAVDALAAGEDRKVLAGGQSLVPLLAMRLARPSALIDINRVRGLDHIRRDGDVLAIGALARHEQVLRSPLAREAAPLLTQALGYVGHRAIRNRGTIGGSIAHADPAAELPAATTALDAQFVAAGPRGRRVIPAAGFFEGSMTTALEPGELLVEVRVPVPADGTRVAVRELARRAGDFALVAVFASLTVEDSVCTSARIALAGAGPRPARARAAERLLAGRPLTEGLIIEAAAAAAAATEPADDIHAPASYRRRMAGVLTTRALADAAGLRTGGAAA